VVQGLKVRAAPLPTCLVHLYYNTLQLLSPKATTIDNGQITHGMTSMASAIHPDYRDDVTKEEAEAVDEESYQLAQQQQQQQQVVCPSGYDSIRISLAHRTLENTLGAYKAGSSRVSSLRLAYDWDLLFASPYVRSSKGGYPKKSNG